MLTLYMLDAVAILLASYVQNYAGILAQFSIT